MTQPSSLHTVKGLARLLYRMGRTFDGLNTSRVATEEFLRTNNPQIIGSRNDYALLCDLRDAARYVLDTDWQTVVFDLDWFRGINRSMSRTAALEPGVIRTMPNILVNTSVGTYEPPVPNLDELSGMLQDATRHDGPTMERASRLFAQLAKAQPFGDGNKRSALLAANGLLIKEQQSGMIAVPVENPDRDDFNRLLAEWYMHDDPTVITWLLEWNETNPD